MIFKKGFTLIELLVTIGVLAVVAAGVIALINPVDKLNQANDAKVVNDIGQIASALQSYAALNSGSYPAATTGNVIPSVLTSTGELTVLPVPPTGYNAYTYIVGTGAKVTGQVKSIKYTSSGATPVGSWCWSSVLGTSANYKSAATTTADTCP